MTEEDDIPEKSKNEQILVGEDLHPFSISELTKRITALQSEIERVKGEISSKEAQANLADNLFK